MTESNRYSKIIELTIADPRWKHRLKELVRVREIFCDAAFGGAAYGTTLADGDRYFLAFAVLCNTQRAESPSVRDESDGREFPIRR